MSQKVVNEEVAQILERALKRILKEAEKKKPDFSKIRTLSSVAIQRSQAGAVQR